MNPSRLTQVFRLDVALNMRRPLFWILILLVGLFSWGLSDGRLMIQSGDSAVGGTKTWITSEFAFAQVVTLIVFLLYTFFIAVAAGMAVIHDDELKVGELLHATPLRPAEYVWGKALAVLFSFCVVLGLHMACTMFFNHGVPSERAAEIRGPFNVMNYLRPAIIIGLPLLVFLTGVSFAVGEGTRRPILVFVLPVALFLVCGFFLWEWAPTWLDPRLDQALMALDPSGFRWLRQTWLRTDRGASYYNVTPIQYDLVFLASRFVMLAFGVGAISWSARHLAATLRGAKPGLLARWLRRANKEPAAVGEVVNMPRPLGALAMRSSVPGLLRGILEVARTELRELRSSPGLYLFAPLIIIQTVGANAVAIGAFQTRLLLTPGTLAVGSMNTLTLLVCLLLLFYTVESLLRERHTGLASIHYATPVRTAALLFGKAVANSVVGVVIVLAALAGCALALAIQRLFGAHVAFEWRPFLLVWGLLLTVTFLAWSAFVMAVLAVTGNRYTTYALCLAALAFTGYRQFTNQMNWVGNWDLWSAVRWSDMGLFEMDRSALVLNRVMVLGLAVFFTALAVRFFNRRDWDSGRVVERLRPLALVKHGFRLIPYALVPVVAGTMLWVEVYQGFQGDGAKKVRKDYWKQNLATWKDAPLPALTAVDLDVELEPARNHFRITGSYELTNHHDTALAQVPVTAGDHFEHLAWKLNDADYTPENRTYLYVFTPPQPLKPKEKMRIGFAYEGRFPKGTTKNGGGTGEFILPSSVVLTSFGTSFVPMLGYSEQVGVDDDNRYEPKVYPDNFYEGVTEPLFGSPTPFTTTIRITAPEEYTLNSVGAKRSDEVSGGKRTVVWESDQPVRMFNIIAGRWQERRGENTVIYFHPGHGYNIDAMAEGLDAARKYYSEWFYPYPWRELKLSEFPNLATYAQGFATNITFSEGIGFLTLSDDKADAAFVITAHEAAHQWWGNLLTPGKGPGGNILSEGMAHFSTVLLCEQVKGQRSRMEFLKRIEENYGNTRRKDAEKPMVKTDGTKPGEQTVMYDKGGWVFYMLLRHMGRERALAGMKEFIGHYRFNTDHPVLQDFVRVLRRHAADPVAYDVFIKQWFFEVVVPEYKLTEALRAPAADSGGDAWDVTVSVQNVGTGKMPLEVAAVKGERFDKDGKEAADYRDARATVTLGAGESAEVKIRCNFQPDRVVADPDVTVLQIQRKFAVVRF